MSQLTLRKTIRDAIKCGPVPVIRPFDEMVDDPQTKGEEIVSFAYHYLIVPEGMKVGQPLVLEDFQVAFILAVFDNPHHTRYAYYSVAKRNGKTFVICVILLAFLVGPLAMDNTRLASGAMSRDQAALAYDMMEKILSMSPDMKGHYHTVPSSKKIIGLSKNTEYQALSSEAKTGHGRAYRIILLDEAGQISGPRNDFTDMLVTSQGSYLDPVMFTVSTQSPADGDYLSLMLDEAEVGQDPGTVSHVYCADADCDIMDEEQWYKANPGLDIFRSLEDLRANLAKASRLPVLESGQRNLSLNQRVALESVYIPIGLWRKNDGEVDRSIFSDGRKVAMGLDLSAIHDFTSAALAAKDDDGHIHTIPFFFCPTSGIEDRAHRDRAPYDVWVKDGSMVPLGGASMDYGQIVEYLRDYLYEEDIHVDAIMFDRWKIELFKRTCVDLGAWQDADWVQVGQGYKDQDPSLQNLMTVLLEHKLHHGNSPPMNMCVTNAIAVKDPAGSVKLDKSKSTNRIDGAIALHQAVFGVCGGYEESEEAVKSIYTGDTRPNGFITF